jgi:hypothetical protein
VPPTRLQRKAATLDELRAAVRTEFGPGARIVAAERITTGGIGGLFRKTQYEATVEVPAPGDEPTARVAIAADRPRRVGIAALLADAEDAEDRLVDDRLGDEPGTRRGRRAAAVAAADEVVEARSQAFASLMDDFTFNGIAPAGPLGAALGGSAPHGTAAAADAVVAGTPVGAEERDVRAAFEAIAASVQGPPVRTGGPSRVGDVGAAPVPPAVRQADGDLVALVGRRADVAIVVDGFGTAHGLARTDADDRRSGILARAAGVQDGGAVLADVSWPDPAVLEGLAPDQVWVVVDAGRKHEDTAAMVRAVAGVSPVAGLVVVGAAETTTPETVHMLGLPVLSL